MIRPIRPVYFDDDDDDDDDVKLKCFVFTVAYRLCKNKADSFD